ncbi:MAG: HupE/UreJ family protein [Granulosicoccus sp.]
MYSLVTFSTVRYRLSVVLLIVIMCSVLSLDANAHTLRPAVATLVLDPSGNLDMEIKVNAESLLADLGPDHADSDDSPNAATYNELRALSSGRLTQSFDEFVEQFLDELIVETDVGAMSLVFNQIVVPEPGDLELSRDSLIRLTGRVPSDAQHIIWRWPESYGSSVVRLSTPGSDEPVTSWLEAGQLSEPLSIGGLRPALSILNVVLDYVVIGFRHILPLGVDHILFVLGLFLLSTQLRPLIWQVSAFTLAHTITLGLTIYGQISLSASIVEPLIALSIAYVGIENCLSAKLKSWRVITVFVFGLLHGMGFAGVLADIGLPEGEYLSALISFNVGVELGQLAVICLAFLLVGFFRHKHWYRRVVVIPGSLVIAAIGLFWTWERVLG